MTKIIIPDYGNGLNRGAAALLSSRIKAIKDYIPDSEFVVFTFNPELDHGMDKEYVDKQNIKFHEVIFKIGFSPKNIPKTVSSIIRLFTWPVLYKLEVKTFTKDERFKEYVNSDLVISVGGDVLTEDYGTLSFISHITNLFFGLLFDIPVIIFAESVGPFKRSLNKKVAHFLFNKSSLIIVREEVSKRNLLDIKVDVPPIYITTDSAFLLKPSSTDRINKLLNENNIRKDDNPLIGISLSKIIAQYGFLEIQDNDKKYIQYINIMAKVIDFLIIELNSTVIFIPHVMEPPYNDDRKVNRDVYQLVNHKSSCRLIENEYSAEDLKGIIGICDLFIGSRMHSTIASTSMFVPTIAIAYSHKTHGIVGKRLKQQEYVIDINNLEYESMVSKIKLIWSNKEEVSKKLETEINEVKKESNLSVKLICNFISKRKILH